MQGHLGHLRAYHHGSCLLAGKLLLLHGLLRVCMLHCRSEGESAGISRITC